MVFNFPVLKVLDLELCEWLEVNLVEINAPSLITFRSATSLDIEEAKYSIKIVGTKLEELRMNFCYPENIVLAGSTITSACLGLLPFLSIEKCGARVLRLLRELPHVKYMYLVGVLEAIACKRIGPPLLRFSELETLYVDAPIQVEGLLELFHAAPFLKLLHIVLDEDEDEDDDDDDDYDYDYDDAEEEEEEEEGEGEDEDDYEGKTVPSCFASYLEGIMFDFSKGWRPKFGLVKFVLVNGLKLKEVIVKGSPHVPANKIIEQLQTFPKGSTCLKFRGI